MKRSFLFWIILNIFVWSKETSIILKRNIFTKPIPPSPKVESILKPTLPPSLDTLIEIVGIIYSPYGNSFAIIKDKKNQTESIYREKDNVGNAKIIKIEIDKVIFEYDNKFVSLNFENKSSDQPAIFISQQQGQLQVETSNIPKIPEKVISMDVNFPQTLSQLETEAKDIAQNVNLIPNINAGKIDGFKVFNLPMDSIAYKYGIRNGDIIRSVNGILIDSLATGFKVYNQIKNSNVDIVTVEIIRNNSPILLTYHLKK